MFAKKSHADSLRAIGQALEILRIDVFSLENEADKYVVRDWEPSFLQSVAEEPQGKEPFAPTQKSRNILIYTRLDAERLDTLGRSRRGSNDNYDTNIVSSGLRLVGDFLDKKKVATFNIEWSKELAKVTFETPSGAPQETTFTMKTLQDLAVVMYLRRSKR